MEISAQDYEAVCTDRERFRNLYAQESEKLLMLRLQLLKLAEDMPEWSDYLKYLARG